jgi:putative membrane protein
MNNFFIKIIISTVNAFVLSHILPGIHMDNFITAFIFAIVLSILDAIIKPILILLTLPVTIVTLGLFLFVINTCMVMIGDHFIDSFSIDGFWHAMLFSIILSFFNSFVHKKAQPKKEHDARQ